MKFAIDHSFTGIDRSGYEKLFFDETFNAALDPVSDLKSREVLERRYEGDRLFRKVKVVPRRELPSVMKKFVSGDIVYVEESWFDPATHVLQWDSRISFSDKLRLGGTIEFIQEPAAVRRSLRGEMKVDIFAVGPIIEKIVIGNLEETYEKIARFTQRWIDERLK